MADIQHTFGSDLTIGPAGDLAQSTGTQWGQDRVLRRLLTNAGAEIWRPNYGAGLPAMVGMPVNPKRIAALVRGQMLQERAVSASPVPAVTVSATPDGTVTAQIQYADASTGDPATLTVPVS